MEAFALPAAAQHLVWVNGKAREVGAPVEFDAHRAAMGLTHEQFSRAARQILDQDGHDYDELALASSQTQKWFLSDFTHGFRVSVRREDFVEWLERYGLTPEEARDMDETGRNRLIHALEMEELGARPFGM